MHLGLKHPFSSCDCPSLFTPYGRLFTLISCKYFTNGFLSPDFWTESLFPLPAQSCYPAAREAEITRLCPWQALTQAGARCRNAFMQQVNFMERTDCTWRWFCKIVIELTYLACWIPVLEPWQKSEELYQLPYFMLQQLMSTFSCLYAKTLDSARQLSVVGLSGHHSFSYIVCLNLQILSCS